MSETVSHEVFNGATKNARNNTVDSWAPAVQLGIYAFNPGGTSEPLLPGQDRVITTPTIYVPSTSSVGARDRITRGSVTYEVDGDPLGYSNPYDSSMDGVEIKLKVVSG
ncbi:MAG: hypothetical protein ACJLS2_02495 [Microcella pacifica]